MRIISLHRNLKARFYFDGSARVFSLRCMPQQRHGWIYYCQFTTSVIRGAHSTTAERTTELVHLKLGGEFTNTAHQKSTRSDSQNEFIEDNSETCYARLVPESRSYFSVQPNFMDSLVSLDQLLERYKDLPLSAPGDTPRTAWISVQDYRGMVNEKVKNTRYQQLIRILKRLNQIHPLYMPSQVAEAIEVFKRDITPEAPSTRISPIDHLGRTLGVGRRKTATGRAWLVEGTGEVLVNGKTLAEAFGRIHDRETVLWPLKSTGRIDKYNIWCRVEGGGTTGQAEALTLAVAKALMGHEPALKPALRRGEFDSSYSFLNCYEIC